MYRFKMKNPSALLLLSAAVMFAVLLFGLAMNALFAEPAVQVQAAEPETTQESGTVAAQQYLVTLTALPQPQMLPSATCPQQSRQAVLEVIEPTAVPASFENTAEKPGILIYQTHSQEAYTIVNGAEYVEAAKWRTADNMNNIARVGATLAYFLENRYGWGVLHDTTDYELPKLSSAYSRSLQGIEKNVAEEPSLDVFIDVHRDAYNASNTPKYIEIDGKEAARILFVVGKGQNYAQQPQWEQNLKLAESVCEKLNAIHPEFCRGVTTKDNRYNQHVSDKCLLIEVGHNENTLEQAMNSIPYLAQAIDEALRELGLG